jgi:aminoglycoside 3-N-acetyltransferase
VEQPALSGRRIVAGLRELGVEPGMTILTHSSLSAFGWVDGGENAVIDALVEAVGPRGLMALPTHTWGTVNARQPVFHETLSRSGVGRITDAFRQRGGVVRSLHPTHSVAAVGLGARDFVADHERYSTPCPPGSPYGKLVDLSGHVLLLGVGLDRCTLIHGFEEWADIPWLFDRTEALWSLTADHRAISVPSRRQTLDPQYFTRDFPGLEPALEQAGAIRRGVIGGATVRLIDAAAAAAVLVPTFREDPSAVLPSKAAATGAISVADPS